MHGDAAGECGLEFDADSVCLDRSAAELDVGHDDVEDVFFDESLEEGDAVSVFTAGDGESRVLVYGAEVVGGFYGIDGFFEPLASCGSEFGFEGEGGFEVEARMAIDVDCDVGTDRLSDGLDAFESGFGAAR